MSSNANLPEGAFLTSINGRQCTAVPRSANTQPGTTTTQEQQQETSTTTTQEQQQTTLQTTTTATQAEQTTSTEAVTTSTTSTTSSTSTTSTSTSTTSTSTVQEEQTSTPAQNAPPPQQTVEQPPPPPPISSEPESTTTAVTATPAVTTANLIPSPSQATPDNARGGGSSGTGEQSTAATDSATSTPVESSQTDPIQTAPTSPAATATVETPLAETEGTSTGTALITTIGTAEGTAGTGASAEADQPTITAIANDNSNSNTERTIAIVGGVVGGIAVLSLIAFLLWFWRKKLLKRRRSTLLTPLSTDDSFGKGEKSYVIDRRSVGPTPRTEKIRADLSYGFSRVRGRLSTFLGRRADSPTPSVNLNRGNSQFIDPMSPHSRSNSRGSSRAGLRGGKLTTKDRLVDWWDRLTEDVNFNWKLRNEQAAGASSLDPFTSSAARSVKEKNTALAGSGQPDFLTLLGMDDKQLEQEASLRRRENGHGYNNSSASDHFLGGLGLDFDGRDPFADSNAAERESAKPGPLVVSQPDNPFADSNAVPLPPMPSVPKPTTYVHEIRRSRRSVSGGAGATATAAPGVSGLPSHFGTRHSRADSFRESLISVESFATRRNKFRSDPFDLEQPELLLKRTGAPPLDPAGAVGMNGSISGSAEYFDAQEYVKMPRNAHTRNDSFTSKYTSGLTLGDWSDPGPDVGPAASRSWDGSEGVGGQQANPNSRPQGRGKGSQGSQGSVGKAL